MAVTLSVVVCWLGGDGYYHRSPSDPGSSRLVPSSLSVGSVELPSSSCWLRFVGLVSFVGEMNRFSVEQVRVDISNTSVVMKGCLCFVTGWLCCQGVGEGSCFPLPGLGGRGLASATLLLRSVEEDCRPNPPTPFPRLTLMTRGISVTFELDEQGHRNRSQTIAGTPRTARAWSRPELSLVVADSF